jgi:hypothetical protein
MLEGYLGLPFLLPIRSPGASSLFALIKRGKVLIDMRSAELLYCFHSRDACLNKSDSQEYWEAPRNWMALTKFS